VWPIGIFIPREASAELKTENSSGDEVQAQNSDHVKPWCKGGQTTLENGQMLCHDCNWTKGKR